MTDCSMGDPFDRSIISANADSQQQYQQTLKWRSVVRCRKIVRTCSLSGFAVSWDQWFETPDKEGAVAPLVVAPSHTWRRPSGRAPLTIGYVLIGLGLIAAIIGLLLPDVVQYPYSPPEHNQAKLPAILAGLGMVQFGIVIWAVGYIARSIYFISAPSTIELEGSP